VRNLFVFYILMISGGAGVWAQAPDAARLRAQPGELEKLRLLVEAGAAPRAALEKALAGAQDAEDEAVLRRTLYGASRIEDTTEEHAAEMVAAARRRVERRQTRLEELKPLVEQGIYARNALGPVVEEIEELNKTLELAISREKFLREMADMARAEEQWARIEAGPEAGLEARPVSERFDGMGSFTPGHWRKVLLAFEASFGKPIPVSAHGETAVHRALGFDHRGRVDVAVNPDDPEGVWLREFLTREKIPFFAFRAAVAGKSTAPHIHIGPPSLRIRVAD
jgi:HAMP domain-containing protein